MARIHRRAWGAGRARRHNDAQQATQTARAAGERRDELILGLLRREFEALDGAASS